MSVTRNLGELCTVTRDVMERALQCTMNSEIGVFRSAEATISFWVSWGCASGSWPCRADRWARCGGSAGDTTDTTSWAAAAACQRKLQQT